MDNPKPAPLKEAIEYRMNALDCNRRSVAIRLSEITGFNVSRSFRFIDSLLSGKLPRNPAIDQWWQALFKALDWPAEQGEILLRNHHQHQHNEAAKRRQEEERKEVLRRGPHFQYALKPGSIRSIGHVYGLRYTFEAALLPYDRALRKKPESEETITTEATRALKSLKNGDLIDFLRAIK